MLTQELRALARRHPAALALPSPLLQTLVRAPVVSVEAAPFEAGRVALLATALEHVASTVQPGGAVRTGGASEAPYAAPPPADAPTRSALQRQERALKKMAQTLPRLLDEVRSGGPGGSEGVRRYAEFAVRAAALLLSRLPFVLCANSSVMLGCLIDLLLAEGAASAPYSACVHPELDGVLGGLCRIARDHNSEFRSSVRKLGQGFLFPEDGARTSGAHGAGGARGVHGAGAHANEGEAKDPGMSALFRPHQDPGQSALILALIKPHRHMARELVVKDLLLPRCLLPATLPSAFSELSNCATVAYKALFTVLQLLKALGRAPNALDSEDAKLATMAVLPVLAHSALRCTGLSGPECHYNKALRTTIFFTLFKLQVKAPGSTRSVLQLLIAEQVC